MAEKETASPRSPLGWLFTVIGVLIILVTLAVALLLAVPGVLGWQQYTVLTGSMEPTVPTGSMVYVEPYDPADLVEGDIITFTQSDGDTVTHRVVRNRAFDELIVTKGDANAEDDPEPVSYARVIGKVGLTLPGAGDVLGWISSDIGKVYTLAFGACGVMFVILGGRLRKKPQPTAAERLEALRQ